MHFHSEGHRLARHMATTYGIPVFPVRDHTANYTRDGKKIPLPAKSPCIPNAHKHGDPLKRTCKGECGALGHGFWDASINPDRIAEMFEHWSARNTTAYGAFPGGAEDPIIVIDLDVADDLDGIASWETFLSVEGEALEPTLAVTTPSAGMHLYYRSLSIRIPSSQSTIGAGIDIRSETGYVVGPGSRISYTKNNKEISGAYRVEWQGGRGAIASIPMSTLERMDKMSEKKTQTEKSTMTTVAFAGDVVRLSESRLEKYLVTLEDRILSARDGERWETRRNCAYSAGRISAGHDLCESEVLPRLVDASLKNTQNPTAESEVIRAYRDGLAYPKHLEDRGGPVPVDGDPRGGVTVDADVLAMMDEIHHSPQATRSKVSPQTTEKLLDVKGAPITDAAKKEILRFLDKQEHKVARAASGKKLAGQAWYMGKQLQQFGVPMRLTHEYIVATYEGEMTDVLKKVIARSIFSGHTAAEEEAPYAA